MDSNETKIELPQSAKRVQEALIQLGLDAEVKLFPEGTRTALDAANAIGTTVAQIAKSLVFRAGDELILVIASGVNRVSQSKLSQLCEGKEISQARAEEIKAVTGFTIGGIPPFGHDTKLRTFFDRDLRQYPEVWAAAGTPQAVFRISPTDLLNSSGAIEADISE